MFEFKLFEGEKTNPTLDVLLQLIKNDPALKMRFVYELANMTILELMVFPSDQVLKNYARVKDLFSQYHTTKEDKIILHLGLKVCKVKAHFSLDKELRSLISEESLKRIDDFIDIWSLIYERQQARTLSALEQPSSADPIWQGIIDFLQRDLNNLIDSLIPQYRPNPTYHSYAALSAAHGLSSSVCASTSSHTETSATVCHSLFVTDTSPVSSL